MINAKDARVKASKALKETELKLAETYINNAVSQGYFSVEIPKDKISKETKKELKSLGYKISENWRDGAFPGQEEYFYVIEW